MTADSTDNATPPKSTKSRTSNFLVQLQIKSESQFQFFVPRDTEEFEFLDLVGFGDVASSVTQVTELYGCGDP